MRDRVHPGHFVGCREGWPHRDDRRCTACRVGRAILIRDRACARAVCVTDARAGDATQSIENCFQFTQYSLLL